MKKNKKVGILFSVSGAILSVIFVFVLTAGITTYFSVSMSSDSVGNVLGKTDLNKLFIYSYGFENKYFTENNPDFNDIPLTKVGFQLATNLKVDDVRTFFARELPGFADFNTKIQVAGKGTNLTTVPIESPPPMDVLLKNRKISQKAIQENVPNLPSQHPTKTTDGKKAVFIYHTHSWESFLPLLQGASSPDDAVSSNNSVSVVGVGDQLAADLEAAGIGTEHSTVNAAQALKNKGWNANNAYQYSRGLVQEAMAGDQDLKFLFDIHRDSLRKDKTTVIINNKSYARLDFIVGESNPNFKQNLELAMQLHAALEKKYPGLSRGVFSKNKSMGNGVYNQDLSPRALLIEVGGVDNNLEETQNAMSAFANIFSEFYWKMKGAGKF